MPTLYLIRGVPGSGKSTFAYTLLQAGLVAGIAEADDYFIDANTGKYDFDPLKLKDAHLYCQSLTEVILCDGCSVAVSNTSTTEKEVKIYQAIANKYGAKFVSVVVENRHNGQNEHNVPIEKIEQMKNRFSIKL